MIPDRPSFLLEQQYPQLSRRGTYWSHYGTYRSFATARARAALLDKPSRITECRVVWRSVPIR
ncbi:hypothetical protein [Sphingobium subterraneum]|uniref:SPOR domain-containing protein n=1 Tax=Sphingobium subterraneum TaxID=627688 RepID=A0A841JA79_9SPHN|nr:hypothetical protein [Sphingobium subterraneum]MBB6125405.1 hypothetical protein [Sphingobium subterraneum]